MAKRIPGLIKAILLSLLLIMISNQIYSYDFDYVHYTTKDGIPHNYINDIYQDSQGFIWLATRNGVCRYDGYNFKKYSTTLENHTIIPSFSQHLLESSEGDLWVFGPAIYSYVMDHTGFKIYSEDFVFAYPDSRGNLWFLIDGTLTKTEISGLEIDARETEQETNNLQLICKERNNKLWVFKAFSFQQLIHSTNGSYDSYDLKKTGTEELIVNSLYIDSSNDIWISTANNGLVKFDPETEEFIEYGSSNEAEQGLLHNYVYSVSEIETNQLWIGTMGGISILDKNTDTFHHITRDPLKAESLSDNAVTCFLKDRSGSIFIGTRYGLNITKNRKFTHIYKTANKNSILHNNVHGFEENDSSNIWIISSGGINKLDLKTQKYTDFPVDKFGEKTLKASPISIVADEIKNFWIGTWQGGLFYFDSKQNIFHEYTHNPDDESSISNNDIMSLFIDSRNHLWIGTWGGGVNLFDNTKNSFTRYQNKQGDANSLSNNSVSSFAEDNKGRLWIGTGNGLNLLIDRNQMVFENFFYNQSDTNSLSNSQIVDLFVSGNFLWVGTGYGLNKMDMRDLSIERIYASHGLPSNQIKGITDDNEGNIWVSTNKGLAKITFHPSSEYDILKIVRFSTSDGLQDDEYLDRSVFKSRNGDIYFGGTNGFNSFDPRSIKADTIAPKCVITELFIDDKELHVGDTLFGQIPLNLPISKAKGITLSYKHKVFSIEFAGLHFMNPSEIKYRYMLKGFNNEWKETGSDNRIASYTNINKGKYEFLLMAGNSDDVWNKEPIKLEIVVIPPFWRSNWFIILLILLISTLIYLIIELRIRIIKKQKNKLEKIVKIRTAEIIEQKESIERQQLEIRQQAAHIKQMNDLLRKYNIELKENIDHLSKARVMQKLLDYTEFKKIFSTIEQCYEYLIELKWGNGFSCIRCGSEEYKEEENNARRCKNCNYKESTTSGTIFHHLRFPIDKAFYILIVTSTGRKINISELSRKLNLRLKTAWSFHYKVKEELKKLKTPVKSEDGWSSLIITPKRRRS